ncbi:MAG: tetrahydrofolate dehydrogenase/cyclohydrolase catalytic domain-containing protein [Mycobacterium sp.]
MPPTTTLMRSDTLTTTINSDTASRAERLITETGVRPTLATVLVGDDAASVTYVRMKRRRCEQLGLGTRHLGLPADTSTSELVDTITDLSRDNAVHGILLQHPMGEHIDERAAFDAIAPHKDVDGVTSASFAAMALGQPGFASCTPGGIIRLLGHYGIELAGRHTVVVGRSPIRGRTPAPRWTDPQTPDPQILTIPRATIRTARQRHRNCRLEVVHQVGPVHRRTGRMGCAVG